MKNNIALGIIDAQRGFMPLEEGKRLSVPGFGELPISNGEKIVPIVNKLITRFALAQLPVFTTQDWHPADTAHFAETPNFTTTWPVHCVANTPGAELHPEISAPQSAIRIKKGMEKLQRGEDDTSYSGYNGIDESGEALADKLKRHQVRTVVLGGLALDYCVGATAMDLRNKADIDVVVALDATRSVAQETGQTMLDSFDQNGIRTMTANEIIQQLETI